MRAVLASICLLATSTQAAGLSCRQPSIAQMFNYYVNDGIDFVVAVGLMSIAIEPETPPFTVTAQLQGQFLDHTSFGSTETRTVEISVHCIAGWCGNLSASKDSLVHFLTKGEDGKLLLDIHACDRGRVVTQEDRVMLEGCKRRGRCTPEEASYFRFPND